MIASTLVSMTRLRIRSKATFYPRARGWRVEIGRLGVEWWWFR